MSTGTEPAADAARASGPRPGLSWIPAQPGPPVRGTVILLPGRGEHPGVYERFGRRLAFDSYAVLVPGIRPDDDPAALSDQIAALAADAVAPVVLAGSDTGALHALALVTEGKLDVEGLLLAAVPGASGTPQTPGASDSTGAADPTRTADSTGTAPSPPEWDDELALRTSCPAHRGRLTADPGFTRGSLFEAVPERLGAFLLLDESEYEAVAPALIVHGGADLVASPAIARSLAARLPRAGLAVVAAAPHDVLNDATHRSVAAAVVQWLERVRAGAPFSPVIELA